MCQPHICINDLTCVCVRVCDQWTRTLLTCDPPDPAYDSTYHVELPSNARQPGTGKRGAQATAAGSGADSSGEDDWVSDASSQSSKGGAPQSSPDQEAQPEEDPNVLGVECLLKRRKVEGRWMHLVKWKGFS